MCPGYAAQYERPVVILFGIVLLIVLASLFIVYRNEIIHGYKVRSLSKTLPHISKNFVGRENEIQELLTRVNFEFTEIRIISIVGSPGFGKSTLAIQLGHKLIDKGVYVHYVNLAEFPDDNIELVLAEKVLKSGDITAKTVTFDRLLRWARERYGYTLLILDNCDNVLHTQKDRFQNTVLQIVQTSTTIKVIMTSRETALHIEHYSRYKVYEISPKAAISLLEQKLPKRMEISLIDKAEIAILTGNVPLALHIVGSLLTLEDPPSPSLVIEELKSDPMTILSPNELPVQLRINASISLSYRYLDDNLKKVAHFLALFDGSFNKGAALNIAEEYQSTDGGMLRLSQYELRNLVDRSLLEYNDRTERYQYHRLIREFLLSKEDKSNHKINLTSFSLGFIEHFLHILYQNTVNFNLRYVDSLRFLDNERHNIYKLLRDLNNLRAVPRRLLLEIVESVTHAIDIGFLTCRFTPDELKSLLEETVLYLDKYIIEFQSRTNYKYVIGISGSQWTQKEYYERVYTQLITTYSDILAECYDEQYALTFMEVRKFRIDLLSEAEAESKKFTGGANPALNPESVPVTTKTKRQGFYVSLGNRYLNAGQHLKVVECQLKIIEDARKCEKENCTYREIGYMYIHINDYKEAAKFLELSLKNENNNLITKAKTLIKLSSLYKRMKSWPWHTSEKEETTISLLIDTCREITKMEDQIIFYHWETIMNAVTTVDQAGRNAGNFLEERLFSVISKPTTEFQLQPKDAVFMLYTVTQYSNHTKTILWGSILLKPFKNYSKLSPEELLNVLKMNTSVSFAKLNLWEISKGLDGLEHVFNTIQGSKVLKNHAEVADINVQICLHLIIRLKYIYPCYRVGFKELIYNILDTILTISRKVGYIIFVTPLDFYAETKAHPIQEESVQTQQTSKALATSNSHEFGVEIVKDFVSFTGTNTYSTLESIWYENISPYNWLYIKLNNFVRFLANILSVCARLWAFFTICTTCTGVSLIICRMFEFLLAPRYLAIVHNPASFQLTRYFIIMTCDILKLSMIFQARLLQNVIGFPWLAFCIETNLAQLCSAEYYCNRYRDYSPLLFVVSLCQFIFISIIVPFVVCVFSLEFVLLVSIRLINYVFVSIFR